MRLAAFLGIIFILWYWERLFRAISLHLSENSVAIGNNHEGKQLIFGSMRFGPQHGVQPMAAHLQEKLAEYGVTLRVVDMAAGGDIDREVFKCIEACDTFLVFGSAKYGEDTGNQASTYCE
jgi:hypothetical protein